eukprot:213588-Pyramimonas_sp.AAC.1
MLRAILRMLRAILRMLRAIILRMLRAILRRAGHGHAVPGKVREQNRILQWLGGVSRTSWTAL